MRIFLIKNLLYCNNCCLGFLNSKKLNFVRIHFCFFGILSSHLEAELTFKKRAEEVVEVLVVVGSQGRQQLALLEQSSCNEEDL